MFRVYSGFLCMPTLPFHIGKGKKTTRAVPFYGLEEEMPILLATICVRSPFLQKLSKRAPIFDYQLTVRFLRKQGFQHALAMLAGLITPPIIFANQLGFTGAQQNQMVRLLHSHPPTHQLTSLLAHPGRRLTHRLRNPLRRPNVPFPHPIHRS